MMKRLRAWLGVALIFLFGLFCGVAISTGAIKQKFRKIITGGPEGVVDATVSYLRRELHLDASQEEMLQQIVVETKIKLSGIRQKTQPEVEATLTEAEQRVRGILNPKQVKHFDEIVAKSHEKWKSNEK